MMVGGLAEFGPVVHFGDDRRSVMPQTIRREHIFNNQQQENRVMSETADKVKGRLREAVGVLREQRIVVSLGGGFVMLFLLLWLVGVV